MKRIIPLILCLMMLLTSCSSNKEKAIRFDIESFPGTLDPQMATHQESSLILINSMAGLTKIDESGRAVPDLAKKWEVSSDEKKYTFTLKENLKWADGRPLTSKDFLYALRRLVSPETNSPYAYKYVNILNAEEIMAGDMPVKNLGVYAPDDNTLIIELSAPDFHIPALMAQTSSYPCNEDFFISCKGKYGLSDENILGCGPFYISSIEGNLMQLKRNSNSPNPARSEKIYFCTERGDAADLFLEGRSEICVVPFTDYEKIKSYPFRTIYNRTFALMINPTSPIGMDETYRKALMMSLMETENHIEGYETLTEAEGIIPPATLLEDIIYREKAGKVKSPDLVKISDLKEEVHNEIEEEDGGDFPKTEIIIDNDDLNFTIASEIQNIYAEKLSLYVNILPMGSSELLKKIENGSYEMAFSEIKAVQAKPYLYLAPFADIEVNLEGHLTTVKDVIIEAENEDSITRKVRLYKACEDALVDEFYVYPLYHAPTYIVTNGNVSGIEYIPSKGTFFFGNAELKK